MAFAAALGAAAMANPIGAIGAGLGFLGMFKKDRPAQPVYTDLRKIVANAKEAGIHPLEAIRSGAGVAGVQGPRINSFTAAANAFDQVDNFLTGTQRAADEKRMFEAQLANIQSDTARMGRIQSASLTSQVGSSAIQASSSSASDRVAKRVNNVEEQYQVDGGQDVDVPVGPDLDEMLSGAMIRTYARLKNPDSVLNRSLDGPTIRQQNDAFMQDNAWMKSDTVPPRVGFESLPQWQQDQTNAFRSTLTQGN